LKRRRNLEKRRRNLEKMGIQQGFSRMRKVSSAI
jgi:hypothetical protein